MVQLDGQSTTTKAVSQPATKAARKIVAFEMEIGGHPASYIRNFAEQWVQLNIPSQIHFVVHPLFFQRHADVAERLMELPNPKVEISSISEAEAELLDTGTLQRAFRGWNLFRKYQRALGASHALIMYSDHYHLPMILRPLDCPTSCMYFRPTAHYSQFEGYHPTWKQRVAAWRKSFLLDRLLKLKSMSHLYCLDPIAAEYIRKHHSTQAKIRVLPDSFVRVPTQPEQLTQLREELGVEAGRKVLLLLGVLDRRKGPQQLLDAFATLSEKEKAACCLMLIGQLNHEIESDVLHQIDNLKKSAQVQIIIKNEYIADTTVQRYYEISDVALTTYQRHMGMSSALIRAGLAKIPVLSSDYGLMGEMVRRHGLGIVVDTGSQQQFAQGLKRVITEPSEALFDQQSSLDFADANSPEALGKTLQAWESEQSIRA